jgi:ribose 1,5-bisphosphokinase
VALKSHQLEILIIVDARVVGTIAPSPTAWRAVGASPWTWTDQGRGTEADFVRAAGQGAFALTWHAHGLRYGVPASIDADLGAARTVVCNVSRAIVPAARARYVLVTVALITAPVEVLASRLATRGRPTDGALSARLARAAVPFVPDVVIENVGTPRAGAERLAAVIRDGRADFA